MHCPGTEPMMSLSLVGQEQRRWVAFTYFGTQIAAHQHLYHRARFFLTACAPRSFLVPTTSFDHGFCISTTKNERRSSFNVGPDHPGFKSCEEYLYSTSSSRFRVCQCPSGYDKGTFFLLCVDELLIRVHLGLSGERTRLHRAWVNLRRHMSSPRPGTEREAIK